MGNTGWLDRACTVVGEFFEFEGIIDVGTAVGVSSC